MAGPRTTVYRLRHIPGNGSFDSRESVQHLLHEALGDVSPSEIDIGSLATEQEGVFGETFTKTATLLFRKAPSLITSHPQQSEWEFTIENHPRKLVLDSHFIGLTPLNDIKPPYRHEYNCIAISGLSSHPFGSWQPHGHDKSFMWIRDALPERLRTTQAWIYGYDSVLVESTSFQSIPDVANTLIDHLKGTILARHANCGISFIAHSLGGLVLKEALASLASRSSLDIQLLGAVMGAVLFGVPNLGMDQTDFLSLVDNKPNASLIEDIAHESDYLLELHTRFWGISFQRDVQLHWGYETKATAATTRDSNGRVGRNGPHKVLVTRESATGRGSQGQVRGQQPGCIGLKSTYAKVSEFQIDANHSDIVKFQRGNPTLRLVLDKLEQVSSAGAKGHLPNQQLPSIGPLVDLDVGTTQDYEFTPEQPVNDNILHSDIKRSIYDTALDRRLEQIEKQSAHTFEWIFQDGQPGFKTWLRSRAKTNKLYWIQGKPGSGKSTLMKFILQDPRTHEHLSQWDRGDSDVVASFFFHHRGSEVQRTFEGLLRSILSNILDQKPNLSTLLHGTVKTILRRKNPMAKTISSEGLMFRDWDRARLSKALQSILAQREETMNLTLFIDALDEYNGTPEKIRDFLAEVVERNYSDRTNVRICFSSRPWGTFVEAFGSSPGFKVQDWTRQDLTRYCLGRISERNQTANKLDCLVPTIVEMAQGVFLWSKLALNDLIADAENGKPVDELRGALGRLPKTLEEYYTEIAHRVPQEDRIDTFALIEILLRDGTMLVDDLIEISAFSQCDSLSNAMSVSADMGPRRQKTSRVLRNCCGGLLETIVETKKNSLSVEKVQFMHQTVRDFALGPHFKSDLLGNLSRIHDQNGYTYIAKHCVARVFDFGLAPWLEAKTVPELTEKFGRLGDYLKLSELTIGKSLYSFFKPAEKAGPWLLELVLASGLHLLLHDLLAHEKINLELLLRLNYDFAFDRRGIRQDPTYFPKSLQILIENGCKVPGAFASFAGFSPAEPDETPRTIPVFQLFSLETARKLLRLEGGPPTNLEFILPPTGDGTLVLRQFIPPNRHQAHGLHSCDMVLVRAILLEFPNIDANVLDSRGYTPLDYVLRTMAAAAGRKRYNESFAQLPQTANLLIKAGARPKMTSKRIWRKAISHMESTKQFEGDYSLIADLRRLRDEQ